MSGEAMLQLAVGLLAELSELLDAEDGSDP